MNTNTHMLVRLCTSEKATAALFALLAALVASPVARAQMPPDAGRLLQEMTIPAQPIQPSTQLELRDNEVDSEVATGGAKVLLTDVSINGVSRFSPDVLRALMTDAIGQQQDLSSLRQLADRVTRFYRANGYPFARAYLPPQQMSDGKLHVEVLEGRYGEITAVGEAQLAAQAQPFLSRLHSGDVIQSAALERAALILGDQPGVLLTPVIRPGAEVGTGDFEARIRQGQRFDGQAGADNYGNRYSGSVRARVLGKWNSPFMLGDQIVAGGVRTNENLWLGHLSYARPLGTSGLRGEASYAHTSYELGKEFAALGATGVADISAVGVSYAVLRTQSRNLIVSMQYQHKSLKDRYRITDVTNKKTGWAAPVSAQFDLRDNWGGGGITYGLLTWTAGNTTLQGTDQRLIDAMTARSQGSFQKLNLDTARLQYLSPHVSVFGRVVGQYTNGNLDSSEKFSLGGGNGVRAYPAGEGNGDRGWFGQLELRYQSGALSPFGFVDAGAIRVNAKPWASGSNSRSISGAGVGVRLAHNRFSLESSAAWSLHGGNPQSDSRSTRPIVWLKLDYAL